MSVVHPEVVKAESGGGEIPPTGTSITHTGYDETSNANPACQSFIAVGGDLWGVTFITDQTWSANNDLVLTLSKE